jgi:hypothetical protein
MPLLSLITPKFHHIRIDLFPALSPSGALNEGERDRRRIAELQREVAQQAAEAKAALELASAAAEHDAAAARLREEAQTAAAAVRAEAVAEAARLRLAVAAERKAAAAERSAAAALRAEAESAMAAADAQRKVVGAATSELEKMRKEAVDARAGAVTEALAKEREDKQVPSCVSHTIPAWHSCPSRCESDFSFVFTCRKNARFQCSITRALCSHAHTLFEGARRQRCPAEAVQGGGPKSAGRARGGEAEA